MSEAEWGSGTCSCTSNNLNQYTAAGSVSYIYDASGNMTADGHYTYTYDPENRLTKVEKDAPGQGQGTPPPGMALGKAVDSLLTYTTGGSANWTVDSPGHSSAGVCAQSGNISDSQQSWLQTTIEGPGTVTFWWKVSSESGCDFLQLWVDGVQRDAINGEEDWAQKTYTITTSGTHTIQWRYQKDGSSSEGDDCGWVDEVQWSGPIPEDPPVNDWGWTGYVFDAGLTYTYDPSGRRIEKKYDGITVLKYVYDGDHCIAEYDTAGNVRRKYIYGPGVDQPICLIEATASYAGTYYYHFDALGSVVALTNSSGNTVEVYEYDVYGRAGASDPNHPNRFLFTGREYDKETGLYYYRARYYNPQIGRFLQTDPVGYAYGMNLYAYCANNPLIYVDPSGLVAWVGWYLSEDDAAKAASAMIVSLKSSDPNYVDRFGSPNNEYFYWIFRYDNKANNPYWVQGDPNDLYGFTMPTLSKTADTCDAECMNAAKAAVPQKCGIVGAGHSHPTGGGDDFSGEWETGSNAPGDKQFAEAQQRSLGNNQVGYSFKFYLLTPANGLRGFIAGRSGSREWHIERGDIPGWDPQNPPATWNGSCDIGS